MHGSTVDIIISVLLFDQLLVASARQAVQSKASIGKTQLMFPAAPALCLGRLLQRDIAKRKCLLSAARGPALESHACACAECESTYITL